MIFLNVLMRRAIKGDKKAFLKLFQQYEEEIYKMAYIYVKNEQDALDVVQETAYKAFKAASSVKEPAYFKTWLIRIAINTAIDVAKSNKANDLIQAHHNELELVTIDETPELKWRLEHIMTRLRIEEKSVILLKYYEDMTFEEISNVLKIPVGSVKTLVYRGLKKMRKEFDKEEYYEK